ncbi:MAG TPA: hypothetical protein DD640_05500 [Clostridiales bacterium]|nr:hypothetical protein [Clostridiales bacterium]
MRFESRCRLGVWQDECGVFGFFDSGLSASLGYARASGIPYGQGLLKNSYVGREFIQPDQLRLPGLPSLTGLVKALGCRPGSHCASCFNVSFPAGRPGSGSGSSEAVNDA